MGLRLKNAMAVCAFHKSDGEVKGILRAGQILIPLAVTLFLSVSVSLGNLMEILSYF